MRVNRREALKGLGGAFTLGAFGRLAGLDAVGAPGESAPRVAGGFPRKADFDIAKGYTYINGAYTHPMPRVAALAARRNVEARSRLGPPAASGSPPADPKAQFATLINARPSEISYIPNASTGENLVVEALGIKRFDGNVVTDTLHFEGALVHLQELQKKGSTCAWCRTGTTGSI